MAPNLAPSERWPASCCSDAVFRDGPRGAECLTGPQIAVLQRGRRWYQPWLLRCDALGQSAVIQRTIRSDMNGPLREMFGRSIL